MDFDLTPAEETFRDEARAWLRANRPGWADDEREDGGAGDWLERRRDWQRRLHEAGYIGLNWPREYGGRGATLMEQLILNQEMIEARAPDPINVIGLGMGGPVIIHHGTEEQKRRYLDRIRSRYRCFCTSVPWWMITGPAMPRPITLIGSGALASIISWFRISCSMSDDPRPPYSLGQFRPM